MATALESKTNPVIENSQQMRERLILEQMKLVRLRISCMNPQKSGLYGEIITVGNKYIGTVRKFVPFGEATEDGWHVPYCIYQYLKDKKYLKLDSKDKKTNGQITTETKAQMLPEFALEVLPPLTKEELDNLAIAELRATGGKV